ncbi:AzlC family ABC transporter permease [Peptoniphilus stercorisuis]|uniref:4-azaleucine resistance transporter AzlC n=1 Tax=Peptoniphilus stercorisuis TaxID=1436965 RepID=A0ABS4KD42_9FIRM|nr:AzlC family ABC transporter permease [Peptoniphilus stercorisuis]MBP2025081.1 4-azaleucine resistance transporter AzlC [Peptoniphilus stercorisuis]
MNRKKTITNAFKAAFPFTIPILAGFMFLGMAYGIYMNVSGFSFLYPMFMSITIFGGSVEFAAVGWLLSAFNPLNVLFLTLMINARHLFYGLSMLDKYNVDGFKRYYLIFGMCDETFSINCMTDAPDGINKGWFMFFVTLLNHIYWVSGATLGGLFGSIIPFSTEGIEFVMTALFLVIFLEQWLKEENHFSSILGLVISLVCLIIFKGTKFMVPAMILILLFFTILKDSLEKVGEVQ